MTFFAFLVIYFISTGTPVRQGTKMCDQDEIGLEQKAAGK